MNWKPVLKIICLTAVAAPATLSAVAGFTIVPEAAAAMAILALIGGLTLSEIQPGLTGGLTTLSNAEVGRIADELLKRRQDVISDPLPPNPSYPSA